MLLRSDMIAALAKGDVYTNVQSVMRENFPFAAPDEELQSLLVRFHEIEAATIPVVENGRLVGLITRDNMAEYVMVQSALAEAEKKSGDGRFKADFVAINRRAMS